MSVPEVLIIVTQMPTALTQKAASNVFAGLAMREVAEYVQVGHFYSFVGIYNR